ncbi:MAG: hypothetical protein RR415_06155 [Ruthenibacterium sp.]
MNLIEIQQRIYTNTCGLYAQAPFLLLEGNRTRPRYNSVVGKRVNRKLVSFFEDDIQYSPKTPLLTRLQEQNKVTEDVEKNVRLTYLICKQCGQEFASEKNNRAFCKPCITMRRKAKSAEHHRRTYQRKTVGDCSLYHRKENMELSGATLGNLFVDKCLLRDGTVSLWLCKCSCGEQFVARQDMLLSGAVIECPCCVNWHHDFEPFIGTTAMLDDSAISATQLVGRHFGFLTVVGEINNSLCLCNCGCGKRIVLATNEILTGKVESCGCYNAERDRVPSQSILIGRRYGSVEIVSATTKARDVVSRNSAEQKYFECVCDCGVHFLRIRSSFANTRDISDCGCGCGTSLQINKEKSLVQYALHKEFERLTKAVSM